MNSTKGGTIYLVIPKAGPESGLVLMFRYLGSPKICRASDCSEHPISFQKFLFGLGGPDSVVEAGGDVGHFVL
jgi:hypothetical protein